MNTLITVVAFLFISVLFTWCYVTARARVLAINSCKDEGDRLMALLDNQVRASAFGVGLLINVLTMLCFIFVPGDFSKALLLIDASIILLLTLHHLMVAARPMLSARSKQRVSNLPSSQ